MLRRASLLLAALLTLFGALALAQAEEAPEPIVSLIVDYADGVEKHFTALPWREGMTVLDALRLAEAHPRGVELAVRGTGERAFVVRIDDLAMNRDGRGWLYWVNDEFGRVSVGAYNMNAGDAAVLRFGRFPRPGEND